MVDNPARTTDEVDQNGYSSEKDSEIRKRDYSLEVLPGDDTAAKRDNVEKGATTTGLLYKVDDVPPWYLSGILGMQHYLMMIGGTMTIPFILCPAMCMADDDLSKGYILSTIIFVSGIITLLQTTFGVRLPIIQGGTFSFLVPTLAILNLSKCPPGLPNGDASNYTEEFREEVWQEKMREVQGAIAVSSLFQILIGFTGLMGLLLRWITPLAIAPTVCLVGLSLFDVATNKAAEYWPISILTVVLMILFSQYLAQVYLPVPNYNKTEGFHLTRLYLFKLFPVLLAILISWAICGILTATDAIEKGNPARTDNLEGFVERAAWLRFPYPFQWGPPTVTVAGVFGMLAGVFASIVESVGDYYACARISGAPPPPKHAINRGIGMEGIGCLLAGLWGTGNGTTSASENIGTIGITKVGSRRVVQAGAMIMLMFGVVSKFGVVFVSIPSPVVGGVFMVMFGFVAAVGLSSLQFVDLNSSRNLFILGFSLFCGLAVPKWLQGHQDAIATGNDVGDQILKVLLQTSMFVGGFLGLFLDNTIPGTDEERGIIKWKEQMLSAKEDGESNIYDLPFGMQKLRDCKLARYLPFSPTFGGFKGSSPCGKDKERESSRL